MNRELEVAWAAGIIEGEGWIGRRSADGYPGIQVGQMHNDLMLTRLKALWGGSICQMKAGQKVWSVSNRKALAVCVELLACEHFQGPKRPAAENVVEYYRTHKPLPRGRSAIKENTNADSFIAV